MRIRFLSHCTQIATVALFIVGSPLARAQAALQFDLPAQSLADALGAVANQTDLNILIDRSLVTGRQAPALKARLTASEALSHLLQGSGIKYQFVDERTVTLHSEAESANATKAHATSAAQRPGGTNGYMHLAQTQIRNAEQAEDQAAAQSPSESSGKRIELEEVVVTGSHIRGRTSSASPVQIYDRDQIDLAGRGGVQEFIQTLPQNFKGGASEGTVGNMAGGGSVANAVGGTGVNLRGLGNDATLVLVNGRRVAPGNTGGNFVDVSMIPLTAVERIEVVPDGASAIYGSDAVGGVINFILRRDFEGAETRLRYGSVSEGHSRELMAGQTIGSRWNSGSALLSYEYFDRTPLDASDKSHTRGLVGPLWPEFTLLPQQERHGVFATLRQAVGHDFDLFADGTYSDRSTSNVFASTGLVENTFSDIAAYSGTLGAQAQLANRFGFELSSSYAASDTRHESRNVNGTFRSHVQVDTSVLSVDAKLDGPLWSLPTGPVLFAIGGQYREETFESENLRTGTAFRPTRDLIAGFLELKVPLLGRSAAAMAGNQLELTLAARSERYSDFGSSNNPKLGLVWQPGGDFKLRGTYGTSFKAPFLQSMNPVPSSVVPFPLFDPRSQGALAGGTNCDFFALTDSCTVTLFVFGGNPDLNPEKATSWTVGADLFPEAFPGLRAHATYYNIRFKDRISIPGGIGVAVFDALRSEGLLGATIIQRNPPPSVVQAFASGSGFVDAFGTGIDTVGALADFRSQNLSEVQTSGIDFGVSYTTSVALGALEMGVDGTYISKFDRQVISTAPFIESRNTVYNPVDLKLRARGIVRRGGLSIAAFINYVDSYADSRADRSVPVDAWITADMSVSYKFGADGGPLRDVSAQLSVSNVTDEDPPFIESLDPTVPALHFDGANANLLGRFVALQVAKRW